MAAVGLVALAANTFCLWLLSRHRSDDCSRNDVVANSAVLLAAGVVLITRSPWPDIAVGLMITALFGSSAITVVRRAILELRRRSAPNPSDSAVPLPYILP